MKYCAKCGARMDSEDLFCPECGAKVEQIEISDENNQFTSNGDNSFFVDDAYSVNNHETGNSDPESIIDNGYNQTSVDDKNNAPIYDNGENAHDDSQSVSKDYPSSEQPIPAYDPSVGSGNPFNDINEGYSNMPGETPNFDPSNHQFQTNNHGQYYPNGTPGYNDGYTPPPAKKGKKSNGTLVGILCGIAALIFIVLAVVLIVVPKSKDNKTVSTTENMSSTTVIHESSTSVTSEESTFIQAPETTAPKVEKTEPVTQAYHPKYTLSFNANSLYYYDSITAEEGKSVYLPTDAPYGYNFNGWLDSNGRRVSSPYVVKKNETLYADLTPKTFNIYLDAQGGYLSESYVSGTYGNYVSLPTPTREGYTFNGWYNAEGSFVSKSGIYVEGSETLYAVWEKNLYYISFIDYGYYGYFYYGEKIEMPYYNDGEYEILGWYDSNGNFYYAYETYTVTGDETFTPYWNPVSDSN